MEKDDIPGICMKIYHVPGIMHMSGMSSLSSVVYDLRPSQRVEVRRVRFQPFALKAWIHPPPAMTGVSFVMWWGRPFLKKRARDLGCGGRQLASHVVCPTAIWINYAPFDFLIVGHQRIQITIFFRQSFEFDLMIRVLLFKSNGQTYFK